MTTDLRSSPAGGALVLGAGIRALGIARSLGRRGIPVWLLADPTDSMACYSRHVSCTLRWSMDAGERLDLLRRLGEGQLRGWAVYPTDDESAALVSTHREQLGERFRLLTSSWPVVARAYDKRQTYALAAQLGLPHPTTFLPADEDDVRRTELTFPVILKPAFKNVANAFTDAKAWPAEDRDELLTLYRRATALVPPEVVMVQELIPGTGRTQLSCAALCVDGDALATLVVRRTRQFPVDFGHSSSFVESVVDPEVEQLARQFLAGAGFTGLVEVEFKRSAGDARTLLLDVNPRVWTWHSIGARAGVDFPYLAWRSMHGDHPRGVRGRPGVRWVRPATDLFAARAAIRAGELGWSTYLRQMAPPAELAPWAFSDPSPAVADLPLLAARTARRWAAHRREARTGRAPATASGPAAFRPTSATVLRGGDLRA